MEGDVEPFEIATDRRLIASALIAVAIAATMLSLILPFLGGDHFARRMKSVSDEAERLKQRQRALLETGSGKSLRYESKAYMKDFVDRFSLGDWLNTEGIKAKLTMAGFRGPQAEIAFLFSRFVAPIVFLVAGTAGVLLFADPEMDAVTKFGIVVATTFAGIKAPELYIRNTIGKRQAEMARAFPDGLDLMLICVESGMSIEHAFRKVSQEIGTQSVALAEEFALATAELSYLPERRTAYNNFAVRTGLECVKQIATVLVQAEKCGTPLANALRLTAQETREARMMAAERKAAALPPQLTVPMILFFLPVLFAVVLGPAGIQISQM
jgi:tight adherence protein C